jgi:thiol-disulfide isomerase/thioredoxin
MRHFIFGIIGIYTSLINAQGIQFFEGTWKDALDKAAKEEKILFVDAFAQWCGPCKSMAKNVFTKSEVGDFFNKNFINLKLDMETPDGRTFGDKYPVSAYPTLFFLDSKGKVIKKVVGGQQAEGLINHGKDALKNNDTSIDLAKEYEKGNRDIAFMTKYIKSLNTAGKPSMKIANDYLNSNPEISEEQKLLFIFEAATEADSKLFETIIENKEKVIKLVSKETFEEKIISACRATVNKAIEYETKELLDEALSKAKSLLTNPDQFQYSSLMYYHHSFNQKQEYLKAAETLVKKVGSDDEKTLKFVIDDMCKNYKDDLKIVNKATAYAHELYMMNESYENLTLYCRLLADNNEVDKAIKLSQSKLDEAKKKEGADTRQLEGLVNYLKNKKG